MPRDTHFEIANEQMTPKAFEKINTLHELLKVAITDFKSVLANPNRFVINMKMWYMYSDNKCTVCMAGAVLANTYHCSHSYDVDIANHTEKNKRLQVINLLRMGFLHAAYGSLNILYSNHNIVVLDKLQAKYTATLKELHRISYPNGYTDFVAIMENMQKDLEMANI